MLKGWKAWRGAIPCNGLTSSISGGLEFLVISHEIDIAVQFYDLDPMNVVWHGNYVRYFEQARCALLQKIDYSYEQMRDSGYAFPVVDIRVKYIQPLQGLGTIFRVNTKLVEWENRLRIDYRILDKNSETVLTKGQTTQLAVDLKTHETLFVCPEILHRKVRDFQ
jgi:acyl-CoA thioester hydrolase